jgi:hypothetical protein
MGLVGECVTAKGLGFVGVGVLKNGWRWFQKGVDMMDGFSRSMWLVFEFSIDMNSISVLINITVLLDV